MKLKNLLIKDFKNQFYLIFQLHQLKNLLILLKLKIIIIITIHLFKNNHLNWLIIHLLKIIHLLNKLSYKELVHIHNYLLVEYIKLKINNKYNNNKN